jgi:hypothetical protein
MKSDIQIRKDVMNELINITVMPTAYSPIPAVSPDLCRKHLQYRTMLKLQP